MRIKQYNADYGGIILKKGYCCKCKSNSFIVDGKVSCCNEPISFKTKKIKKEIDGGVRRKQPSAREKKRLLDKQDNRCIYCGLEFGIHIWRSKTCKFVKIKTHYDHFIPYVYRQNNTKENFVASCHICNGIKSSLMFETIEDVKDFVMYQRKKKGYEADMPMSTEILEQEDGLKVP